MLRLLSPSPFCCCMPWHARDWNCDEPMHGAVCCFCGRSVAAPAEARGKTVACVYCGLDRGLIPKQEIEPHAEPRVLFIRGMACSF